MTSKFGIIPRIRNIPSLLEAGKISGTRALGDTVVAFRRQFC